MLGMYNGVRWVAALDFGSQQVNGMVGEVMQHMLTVYGDVALGHVAKTNAMGQCGGNDIVHKAIVYSTTSGTCFAALW